MIQIPLALSSRKGGNKQSSQSSFLKEDLEDSRIHGDRSFSSTHHHLAHRLRPKDAYVGIMKGVILSLSPDARLVDLSHEAPPQDILSGALMLQSAWRYFPPGTIHLAVVDPGVGSRRRLLGAAGGEQFFVGPDNGLFSLVFAEQTPLMAVSLENPQYFLASVAATFHGRDILAPVAAHLSLGVPLTAFGPASLTR